MQNIRIYNKNNNKTYYIAILDSNSAATMSKIASSYSKITQVINYSLKKVYPTDITITDIKNFGCPAVTKNFIYHSYADMAGPSPGTDAGQTHAYDYYSYTFTYRVTSYTVTWPGFKSAELQNLGGLLAKLIRNAHTHK